MRNMRKYVEYGTDTFKQIAVDDSLFMDDQRQVQSI